MDSNSPVLWISESGITTAVTWLLDLGTIDTSRVVELSTQQPKNLGN